MNAGTSGCCFTATATATGTATGNCCICFVFVLVGGESAVRSIGSDFLGTCFCSLLVVVVCCLGGWKEGSCLERRLRSDEVGLDDLGCVIGGGAAGGGGRFLLLLPCCC